MRIKNTHKLFGEPVEGALEKFLAGAQRDAGNNTPAQQSVQQPVNVNINIASREYIQIGINGLHGKPVVISCYELQGSNKKDYEDAHRFVLQQGLYVPTPLIFSTHFKNVIEAKEGRKQLFYADVSPVNSAEIDEIYKHLTTNYKNIFGSNDFGAWTWLNAKFVQGSGDKKIDLETITGIKSDGTFIIKTEPLECKIWENCFVEIDFNRQGLPKVKSANQSYAQGDNINFYFPVKDTVARFYAGSNRAVLYCNRNPLSSSPSLGVFACAEGAAGKK